MECNKEEALRAKDIAEKKMAAGDFPGAQKMAGKAQQLFPALDDVTYLLTVCEVHCSAQNKIPGTEEPDLYTILQIERTADETAIKNQYKKLALMVHPDKNKFPGAEAAFKLIGEANEVLSDKAKRSTYDLKFRTVKDDAPKSQSQPSQSNTFRKQQTAASNFQNGPHSHYGATNNVPKPLYMQFSGVHPSQNADNTPFWTCCGDCNIRYRTLVNEVCCCQSCQRYFAYCGVPPGQPWSDCPDQDGIPNPTFRNVFPNPGQPWSDCPDQDGMPNPPFRNVFRNPGQSWSHCPDQHGIPNPPFQNGFPNPGQPWSHCPDQDGIPNPPFQNGFPNPGQPWSHCAH